jgi:hypothetical protein
MFEMTDSAAVIIGIISGFEIEVKKLCKDAKYIQSVTHREHLFFDKLTVKSSKC